MLQIKDIRVTICATFQTLAGVLNLAGPPLLGLLASRLDTATVMLVLGASLVLGAAPLALASIVRACVRSTFTPVPPTDPS